MSIFKFDYVSEADLGPTNTLLTAGDGKFKIIGAYDSKKDGTPLTTMDGSPKLRLSLSVTDCNGETSLVYDDITGKMAWKIKAILDSVGLGALYDKSGAFSPEDIIGATGKCVIEIRTPEGSTEKYNNIKKYVKAEKQAVITRNTGDSISLKQSLGVIDASITLTPSIGIIDEAPNDDLPF